MASDGVGPHIDHERDVLMAALGSVRNTMVLQHRLSVWATKVMAA